MDKAMSELKKIRTVDLGINQFELSKRTGVHPSRLSLLENGLTMPTMNEAKRISEALGMLPEEVFGPEAALKRLNASRKRG